MCGLCGIAGDLTKNEQGIFRDLLVMSSLRGKDSTGIARIPRHRNESILWLKDTGDPYQLMEHVGFAKVMDQPARAWLGHTRSATVGKINRLNAHPFIFDPIVGMHNGTLHSTRPLEEALKAAGHKDNEAGTDSELIIKAIRLLGPEETIKHLCGAYALVWYNWEDSTLNMVRNNERELYYHFDDTHRRLIWASEPSFIYAATNRPFYAQVLPLGPGKVNLLPVDRWYSWEVPQKWNDKFDAPKVVSVRGLDRPKAAKDLRVGFDIGGDNSEAWKSYFKDREQKVISFPRTEVKEGAGITLSPERMKVFAEAASKLRKDVIIRSGKKAKFFKGWNGVTMDRKEYDLATSKGCAWCTTIPEWNDGSDPDVVRFIDSTSFLCNSCMRDEEVLEVCGLKA